MHSDPLRLMAALEKAISQFNSEWPDGVLDACVYDIPHYVDGLTPDVIEPQRVVGKGALTRCRDALSNFERDPLQHPGSVFRLPGYVCADRLFLDHVDAINQLKDALKRAVQERFPTERARNRYYRQAFPRQVMLQVFRHIPSARAPLEAVRFTWSPPTSANRKITQSDALEMLIRRHVAGTDRTNDGRRHALRIAIDEVKHLSHHAQLLIKAPRSPYPIATLYTTRGKHANKTMVATSLPVFLGPGVDGAPVNVGALRAFDRNRRNKQRSDTKKDKVVFLPLHMYARST